MASSRVNPPERNMLDFNPFRVLGVSASSTDDELKKTFHKKMRASHPDKVKGKEDLATNLNQAYDLLKNLDPEKRLELERAYSGEAPEQSTSSVVEMEALSEPEENKPVLSMVIQEPPIFPSLIWDMILGMLEDSKDISNAVTAIPELAPLVKRKAHMWRFGEVLPHLLPWLKLDDILPSRLACRRWSCGLDQFLESHPNFNDWSVVFPPQNGDYADEPEEGFFSGVRRFWSLRVITEFLHDMRNHPAHRNPFVGRQVCLEPDSPGADTVAYMRQFWDQAETLLRKFGHHVWYLRISTPPIDENPGVYCQSLLNIFRHLPNLKCFSSEGGYPTAFVDDPGTRSFQNGAIEAVNNFIDLGIPPPPQLESIFVPNEKFPSSLVNFLLSWSAPQLRQLSLNIDREGRSITRVTLQNLNELSIADSTLKRVLHDLLRNLEELKVTKLKLYLGRPHTAYEMEGDIFPFLKKLSNLECLTIQTFGVWTRISETETLSPATDSVPSLKSLTIASSNGQLNYNFILCFPALEFLEIECKSPFQYRQLRRPPRPQAALRLAEFLQNGRLYESNVWELLPELELITLTFQDREGYHTHYLRM